MMIFVFMGFVSYFIVKRDRDEKLWRDEQRMYWARLRKDLNEVRKSREQH